MKRLATRMALLACIPLAVAGCGGDGSSSSDDGAPTPSGNFRLLVSDDVNAISDFSELWVSISSIGLHQGGESESWIRLSPSAEEGAEGLLVDLVPLAGTAAQEVWSGTVPPGEYTKAFLYVDDVWGYLAATGERVELTLPSSKLQMTKPFVVEDGAITAFVYDITVVSTGNEQSGVGYLLKPQIAESGADQDFQEVTREHEPGADDLQLVLTGNPFVDDTVTLVVTDDGDPVDGAVVKVDRVEVGVTDENGTLVLALDVSGEEIEIKARFEKREGELEIEPEEEDEGSEWFEGTITALTEGTDCGCPWTVGLEGAGIVTVYVAELEGIPEVGAWVEIEGVLRDGVIQDAEAEVAASEGLDEDGVGEEDEACEWFEGTITALTDSADYGSPWTVGLEGVGTVTVYVAELEGLPEVGAWVEIEGVLSDDVIEEAHAWVAEAEEVGSAEEPTDP